MALVLVFLALLLNLTRPAFAQFTLLNVGYAANTNGFQTTAYSVAVSGNYAYVANGFDGLRVFDVSNQANPVNLSHVTNGGPAWSVAVMGNLAYVAGNGIWIYDISNPANPISTGHTGNFAGYGLALQGNYAYVGSSTYLNICDVSDPTNPTEVRSVYGYGFFGVAVSDYRAYVAGSQMQVYDISSQTNAVLIGKTNTSSPGAITVSGNYAYLADSRGLDVYDVSIPTSPSRVALVTNNFARGVAVAGNLAYVGYFGGRIRAFDISNPAAPIEVGTASAGSTNSLQIGPVNCVAVSGNYAYLANGQDGLRVYLTVPQLSIGLINTNAFLISWPAPPVNSFVLQQNSELSTTNWVDVTNAPVVVSNRNQVVLSPSANSAFYRLKYP